VTISSVCMYKDDREKTSVGIRHSGTMQMARHCTVLAQHSVPLLLCLPPLRPMQTIQEMMAGIARASTEVNERVARALKESHGGSRSGPGPWDMSGVGAQGLGAPGPGPKEAREAKDGPPSGQALKHCASQRDPPPARHVSGASRVRAHQPGAQGELAAGEGWGRSRPCIHETAPPAPLTHPPGSLGTAPDSRNPPPVHQAVGPRGQRPAEPALGLGLGLCLGWAERRWERGQESWEGLRTPQGPP